MHPTFGEEDKIHGEPMATPQTTKAKVSNFFYHYKWHTVIASFLAVVLVICSFQFCSRESYDIHVMYAGPKGLVSAQTHAAAISLEGIARDYNGDGSVRVSFNSLYIDKSIGNNADANDIDSSILAQRSYENYETFVSEMQMGNYLILLLSPELFRELDTGTGIFMPVAEFATVSDADCVGENRTGVRISALPIYSLAGISALPKDTVLCIRQPSAISEWYKSMFGKTNTEKVLGYHKDFFSQMLIHIPAEEGEE